MTDLAQKPAILNEEKKPNPQDVKLDVKPFSVDDYFHYRFTNDKRVVLKHNYRNSMLNTIMAAYNNHLPLHLYPDDVQLLLDNIVSQYINEAPETFRDKFVNHSDKKELHVEMDDLKPTKESGVWDLTIEKWASMIHTEIKDKKFLDAVMCNFSTSTYLDKVCSAAYAMDCTKAYFAFSCSTCCGIPRVHLYGTVADWEKLLDKIQVFGKLLGGALESYLDTYIKPILNKFLETKKGNLTKDVIDFWGKIISHKTIYGSGGGTYWSGWIINFFPTVRASGTYDWSTNNLKPDGSVKIYINDKLNQVPSGVTNVPIKFDNNGTEIKLTLHAGFQGTEQLPDGGVKVIKGYYLKKDM